MKQGLVWAFKLCSIVVITFQLEASQHNQQQKLSDMVPLKPLYSTQMLAPANPSINESSSPLHVDIEHSEVAYSALNDSWQGTPEIVVRQEQGSMDDDLAAMQKHIDQRVASKQGWTKGMCGALCIGLAAWSGVIAVVYYSGRSH